MDVKNAFLNGDLEEEIFIKQPLGFSVSSLKEKVCYLFKTIYGLKQSSQCWYKKLCNAFLAMGFTVCAIEHGIFNKHDNKVPKSLGISAPTVLARKFSAQAPAVPYLMHKRTREILSELVLYLSDSAVKRRRH